MNSQCSTRILWFKAWRVLANQPSHFHSTHCRLLLAHVVHSLHAKRCSLCLHLSWDLLLHSVLLLWILLRNLIDHLGLLAELLLLWHHVVLLEIGLTLRKDLVLLREQWIRILLLQPLLFFKFHPCVLRLRVEVDGVSCPKVWVILHANEDTC